MRVQGRVRPGSIVLVGVSNTYRLHLSTASCTWSGLLDVLLLVEGSPVYLLDWSCRSLVLMRPSALLDPERSYAGLQGSRKQPQVSHFSY